MEIIFINTRSNFLEFPAAVDALAFDFFLLLFIGLIFGVAAFLANKY